MSDLRYDWQEIDDMYKSGGEKDFIAMHGLLGALAILIATYDAHETDCSKLNLEDQWRSVRRCLYGDDRIRFDTLIPYEQGRAGTYAYPTLVKDYAAEFNYVYRKTPRPRVDTERLA